MKIAVITGANSGIGYWTTHALAKAGYTVIMGCVNIPEAVTARNAILEQIPDARLIIEPLDLADFSTVQAFTTKILDQYPKISLLINNAGINNAPFDITVDGFESTFQTNYLGHWLLTKNLLPLLEISGEGRIINVSSYGHHNGVISFDNPYLYHIADKNKLQPNSYHPFQAYFNSKLAILLFSYELHRRLCTSDSSVKSIAVHPGSAQTNMLQKHQTKDLTYLFFSTGERLVGQTAQEGARCSIKACLDSTVNSGDFLGPNGPFELWGEPTLVHGSVKANDINLGMNLWQHTANLFGESLELKNSPREHAVYP